MFLPIVSRELRVRSRMASTVYTRFGTAALVLLMTLMFGFPWRGAAGSGHLIFIGVGYVLFVFCLFEGVRLAAGLISDERREGTLGLLFLTHLGPMDVLLGKVSGAALTAGFALIATLPVLAVALLLGGVTGGEFVRVSLMLMSALAVSIAAGTWSSVRMRDGMASIIVALAVVAGLCVLPLLAEVVWQLAYGRNWSWAGMAPGLLSPVPGLTLASDAVYPSATRQFWVSQGLQWLVAAWLLAAAARSLHRSWRPEAAEGFVPPVVAPGKAPIPAPSPAPTVESREVESVDVPALVSAPVGARRGSGLLGRWLAPGTGVGAALARRFRINRWLVVVAVLAGIGFLQNQLQHLLTLVAPTVVVALGAILSIPTAIAALTMTIVMIYLSARTLGEAKHSGELELLLTTPVGHQELIRSLWHELRRFPVILTAFAVASFGITILTEVAQRIDLLPRPAGVTWEAPQLAVQWVGHGVSIGVAWLSTSALIRVAMWFSLTTTRVSTAVGKTFLLVVIGTSVFSVICQLALQWIVPSGPSFGLVRNLLLPFFYPVMMLLVYLAWNRWAQARLDTHFRTAAAGVAGLEKANYGAGVSTADAPSDAARP